MYIEIGIESPITDIKPSIGEHLIVKLNSLICLDLKCMLTNTFFKKIKSSPRHAPLTRSTVEGGISSECFST